MCQGRKTVPVPACLPCKYNQFIPTEVIGQDKKTAALTVGYYQCGWHYFSNIEK